MVKNNFRSIELKDASGVKWRRYGNAASMVFQKKLGRSWATWTGGIPVEILVESSSLTDADFTVCQ